MEDSSIILDLGIEVNGQLQASIILLLGKELQVPIMEKTGWVLEPACTRWRRKKSLTPYRESNPSILRNPKVHHRVHRSPPLVPILSQNDRYHPIPSDLSKIFLVVSFLLTFPPISYMRSSAPPPPFVLHALLISSSLS
jgi:hypothetical protein